MIYDKTNPKKYLRCNTYNFIYCSVIKHCPIKLHKLHIIFKRNILIYSYISPYILDDPIKTLREDPLTVFWRKPQYLYLKSPVIQDTLSSKKSPQEKFTHSITNHPPYLIMDMWYFSTLLWSIFKPNGCYGGLELFIRS